MYRQRCAVAFGVSSEHEAERLLGATCGARMASEAAASKTADPRENIEGRLAALETAALIRAAIGGLTLEHAAVIVRRHFDGLTNAEIAAGFSGSGGGRWEKHRGGVVLCRGGFVAVGGGGFFPLSLFVVK